MDFARFQYIGSFAANRDLVFCFFAVFSRFECALKRSGFLRKDMDEAMPDWKRFGSKIKGRFSTVKHPDFLKALEYLLKNPPRTQMRSSENTVRWVNTPRWRHEANEAYLLRLVRTVRNNLFHGGKYPQEDGGEVKDEGRNERFLEAGLTILSQCLLSYPALEVRFAEAA